MTDRAASTRDIARQLCPPLVWNGLKRLGRSIRSSQRAKRHLASGGHEQDLDLYWDPEMARILETWGEDNVWKEIQLLLVGRHGRVLDIACGTGKVMELVANPRIEVHGCDISDMLIGKALERGLAQSQLTVCDATNLPYDDDAYRYAYSIGSLEHFTEDGIGRFLAECHRVTRKMSFHNIPVSRSGKDEGWITPYQAYHNNSVAWWLAKYRTAYESVDVLDSMWSDDISVGKWFVCTKRFD